MRKQFFVLIAVLFIALEVIAQAPKGIKYQTVVRDAAGALIANQQVNITLSILKGSATGLSICTETFAPTTNEFGLVNLEIGSVNPTAFVAIDWTNGPYFTKVELNGTVMGTSQLLSVPYALYAENSSNSLWNANGSSLYYNGGNVGIGISSPNAKLDLRGSFPDDGANLLIGNSDASHWMMLFGGRENDPNPFIWWKDGDPLRFSTDKDGWSEKMRITSEGNVGIGTDSPIEKLHIKSGIGSRPRIILENRMGNQWFINGYGSNNKFSIGRVIGADDFVIDSLGNVGLGVTTPSTKLSVEGDVTINGGSKALRLKSAGSNYVYMELYSSSEDPTFRSGWFGFGAGDGKILTIKNAIPDGKILLSPESGIVTVPILEITGGSDLAEPFEITCEEPLLPGSVVVIDINNSGKLIKSYKSYDKRVAGIISGAGGIKPGITLQQEGAFNEGQHVALAGKVYVNATTANGAIEPGDLLTTSNKPGFAMKATDPKKSFGAVIGKALSSLEDNEGIVLILVNLQ